MSSSTSQDSKWMEAMRRGDFQSAWNETDRIEKERRELESRGSLIWCEDYLLWNGAPFTGRRVLIRCNHGLGDTLQFLRFVPMVRAMASEVTLLVQPALLHLLNTTDAFGEVRDAWSDAPLPGYDVEIEIMELPYAFRCTTETLPKKVPYLPVDSMGEGRGVVPIPKQGKKFRVGLLWQTSTWAPQRSIPLESLDPLCSVPGVQFYSLQQGVHHDEIAKSALALQSLAEQTQDIRIAAMAMLEMDLILTVDSMAAHLAGALGRPVWVLLRREADWRWLTDRSDSPWYPTMRIFRQPREGEWDSVVEEIAQNLRRLVMQAVP